MNILGFLFRKLMIDRKSKGMDMATLQANLVRGKKGVLRSLTAAADTEKNRATIRHVIGIERWGQSRLRVLLGDPLIQDEYDNYAPADSLTMAELEETFTEVRDRLLGLVEEMKNAGIPLTETVLHNAMGNLSLRSWLYYLTFHSIVEMKRVKEK